MGRRSAAGLSRERLFTTRAVATGVVPACASLDCVTVFAPTVAEGALVATHMLKASQFPADATVTRAPAWSDPQWTTLGPAAGAAPRPFAFSAPADALLGFEGPRGAEYAEACRGTFAAAVARCAARLRAAAPRVDVPWTACRALPFAPC